MEKIEKITICYDDFTKLLEKDKETIQKYNDFIKSRTRKCKCCGEEFVTLTDDRKIYCNPRCANTYCVRERRKRLKNEVII